MRIVGGQVYRNGSFTREDVHVRDGLVVEIGTPAAGVHGGDGEALDADAYVNVVLDASGCYVVPGFIDLHFHGCMGHDFCEGTQEAIHALAAWEASQGVTAICPATMTFPESVLGPVMDAARAFEPGERESELLGINMEGPFISPDKVGAQNPAYVVDPDIDLLKRLQERSGGKVKLVDIAPERPGALAFIDELAEDVRISLAHTCADYDMAAAAFAHGARHVTHTCNAMPGLGHRVPGPIAAAFDCPDATIELICDGVHVHPAMVRVLFGLFGAERIILISDTMEAAGLADGEYELGGQAVTVRGNRATLHDGTIAGGVTNVAECLRIAVRDMGIPLEDAVRAASENPARSLGVFDQRGSLDVGKVADVVILDENLSVRHVLVRGTLL